MESVGVASGIGAKVGLAVVLAVGATAAARYIHLARHGWRPGRGRLRVLETAVLGQNRAVHLVSVGSRTLFIASTPSQVVMLADVTEERDARADEADLRAHKASHLGRDFGAVLKHLLAPGTGLVPRPKSRSTGGDGAAGGSRAERLLRAARALRATRAGGWVG